jgi:hypothetical protein
MDLRGGLDARRVVSLILDVISLAGLLFSGGEGVRLRDDDDLSFCLSYASVGGGLGSLQA